MAVYGSLNNRHVLITGGASGIGANLVEKFAEQKANVSFIDIDEEAGNKLRDDLQGEVSFFPANICNITELEAVINQAQNQYGEIGCLINNAARDTRYQVNEVSEDIWNEMHAVNLRHVFFASKAVHKGMKSLGGGSIINFTSTSFVKRSPLLTCYGTSKAAIIGLTRTLSREFGVDNIRVNSIMPGWVMTERQKTLWLTPELEETILKEQSLKTFIQPDDVSNLALFLASDESKMISAQNYIIDGGWV